MDTFGKRLVFAREQLGLTQKELAKSLNITPTRLNYWEKDKREPDISMIKNLSNALNVDPNFLIGIWSEDLYDDYQNAGSDEEKLLLFKKRGVPSSLACEYRRLTGKSETFEPTEEEIHFISLFRLAEEADRQAITLMLLKYEDRLPSDGSLTSQKNTG